MQGKIPNAAIPGSSKKLLANTKVQGLLAALDPAGIGELPLSEIRYQKLILLSDPDADGLHARSLLIAFFYTCLRTVVERGSLYIAYPPLYRIESGALEKTYVAFTKSEYEEVLDDLRKHGDHHPAVSRYKGLGSLGQQLLHQCCIDVQGRRISQLGLNDCEALLANMRRVKS